MKNKDNKKEQNINEKFNKVKNWINGKTKEIELSDIKN